MTANKRQFLAATLLALFASTGCSVDFGRRGNPQNGTLATHGISSNHSESLKASQVRSRTMAGGVASSYRNQSIATKRGTIQKPPSSTLTSGKTNQSIPSIVAAASMPVREQGTTQRHVSTVSHSELANPIGKPTQETAPIKVANVPGSLMTLAQFEELALRSNPTIGQASADISKASALRDQVGRYPNPVMGYFGSQIADAGTDQHGVFVEQEIVRGGKLPLNQKIMRHAIEAQTAAAESQTLRVLTDVRIRFFIALAAQEQMKLTRAFGEVATEGVEIASRRKAAQEGSQPELLQAQIQLSEVELTQEQSQVAFNSAFRDLAAVAGASDLQPTMLEGDLSQQSQTFDWGQVSSDLMAASPELQVAQARLQQACAQLQRERVQAIPNPTIQLGGGVDNGTGSGLLNVQVSAPIPVFNSNRGNIYAAQADYDKASQEITRIELAIKSRLAVVSREFDSAFAAVRKYESEILPKSKESLDLTESLYRAGEIDFLQAFLVRKTYFESNLRYIQSLSELAQARSRIDGLLLEGGLEGANSFEGDDSSRERVFSQK